jgi:ribose-phosphate pyrophosphokinase
VPSLTLFTGNANPELAAEIAESLGVKLGDALVSLFSDGEINIEVRNNVRGHDVFVVQPTCVPTNRNLMELVLMVDALRRASAGRITAVVPYFGYARQDRRVRSVRVPISAKVVADMLSNAGVDRVLTVDLHAEQIQGFFNIPVLHMEGKFLFDRKINDIYKETDGNIVLCSPDAGGAKRMKGIRDWINKRYDVDLPMILIDKTRTKANKVDDMVVIGEVEGKDVIIIDDMADTCGTLVKASTTLLEKGAKSVRCMVTHGVLSEPAIERLHNAINYQKTITEFICSDTLPLSEKKVSNVYTNELINGYDISTVVSTAPHIIKAMKAIQEGVSVQSLKTKK